MILTATSSSVVTFTLAWRAAQREASHSKEKRTLCAQRCSERARPRARTPAQAQAHGASQRRRAVARVAAQVAARRGAEGAAAQFRRNAPQHRARAHPRYTAPKEPLPTRSRSSHSSDMARGVRHSSERAGRACAAWRALRRALRRADRAWRSADGRVCGEAGARRAAQRCA
jgi:hypothetical protein